MVKVKDVGSLGREGEDGLWRLRREGGGGGGWVCVKRLGRRKGGELVVGVVYVCSVYGSLGEIK